MRRQPLTMKVLVPHAVTASRLLFAAAFVFAFDDGETPSLLAAAALIALAALSDFADGALARRWNTVSTLGKWADPLFDALFFLAVYISFTRAGLMPPALLAAFIARETVQYAVVRPAGARLRIDPGARPAGKIKTALQVAGSVAVVALRLAVATEGLSADIAGVASRAILTVLVAVSVASLYWYVVPLIRLSPDRRLIAGIVGAAACHLAANLAVCSLAGRIWAGTGALPGPVTASFAAWFAALAAFLVWRRRDLDAPAPPEALNLPCQLTLVRLGAAPSFAFLLVTMAAPAAGPALVAALALVFLTDLVDGRLARATGAATAMGRYLDPVADYVLLGACVAATFAVGAIPAWYLAVFAARFGLFPIAMGILGLRRGRIEPESTFLGKVTVFSSMAAFAVQIAGRYEIPAVGDPRLVAVVEYATAGVLAVSLFEKLRWVALRWRAG